MADGGEAAALNPGSRRLLSSTLSPLAGLVVSGGAGVLKRDVDGEGVRTVARLIRPLWFGDGDRTRMFHVKR